MSCVNLARLGYVKAATIPPPITQDMALLLLDQEQNLPLQNGSIV